MEVIFAMVVQFWLIYAKSPIHLPPPKSVGGEPLAWQRRSWGEGGSLDPRGVELDDGEDNWGRGIV